MKYIYGIKDFSHLLLDHIFWNSSDSYVWRILLRYNSHIDNSYSLLLALHLKTRSHRSVYWLVFMYKTVDKFVLTFFISLFLSIRLSDVLSLKKFVYFSFHLMYGFRQKFVFSLKNVFTLIRVLVLSTTSKNFLISNKYKLSERGVEFSIWMFFTPWLQKSIFTSEKRVIHSILKYSTDLLY